LITSTRHRVRIESRARRIDPYLENLREEPEFTRLMAELEQTYSTFEIIRL